MVSILAKQQPETEDGGGTVGEKAGMDQGGLNLYIYILYVYRRHLARACVHAYLPTFLPNYLPT